MNRDARALAVGEIIADWFDAHGRPLPWRAQDFTAWGTLVSEFMLQQTPVDRVVPALAAWLDRWPTAGDLARASPADAVRAWNRLGYPRRALRLHASAVAITERYGGDVPREVDELLTLPGVGRYTAHAVAAFAYGERVPVVDTNVRRVLARAVRGEGEAGPPRERDDLAQMSRCLPADSGRAQLVNAGMMEFGQVICRARVPNCDACPLARVCVWRERGYPAYAGPRAPRQASYLGSDRHARGVLLGALREASSVDRGELLALVDDPVQSERALLSLVNDGLAVVEDTRVSLPDSSR